MKDKIIKAVSAIILMAIVASISYTMGYRKAIKEAREYVAQMATTMTE